MNSLRTPWKVLLASLLLMIAAWSPRIALAAPVAQPQLPSGETVRLLVKVAPNTPSSEIAVLSEEDNAAHALAKVGWEVIEVSADEAAQVKAELQGQQDILEVTEDYPLELTWNPNDPAFAQGEQWALDTMGAHIAWEFSTGEAITIAVIDSGIDHNHPDLAGRIVPGYNFIDKNTDTTDLCGHGTHVAGIIAAETNNAEGVAGVAHQALIMPVKVIGANCSGSYSRLMQGIIYAVDQGVRVISITSGGGFDHDGLHDAIKYAREKGVFVAVSAGNRGNDQPFYPGSFEESFTVAGTDAADQQYTMSTYGQQIDISAPGVSIFSTYWSADEGSTYAYMTGTSMAAPHVAAVAALVLAIDPKLPLEDLERVLTASATDLSDAGWDPHFGWGRLTAWRAVAAVSPAAGNVRLGHFRVPNMETFTLSNIAVNADTDSIDLSWTQSNVASDQSVVIYRSIVPVFEAAEDIAEVTAAAKGSYSDTTVEAGQEYFYWLVQVDNDVEVAITDLFSTKLATTPQEPVTPEEPVVPGTPQQPETPEAPEQPAQPAQPAKVAMFIPLLQR